ncbi:MAG: diguanylate cyclase domain-containing protein [Chloroflexota bacterium]
MKDIRRQLLILALYLILTFNLERLDLNGQTIINFRPYFYALVIAGILSMLVFPVLQRTSIYVLLALWGTAYTTLWLIYARENGLTHNLQIVIIQFIFLEASIWMTHELTNKINQTEGTLNSLITNIFPNRVMDMASASKWIDNEMTRSRRHNHPLSVLIINPEHKQTNEMHPIFEDLQQEILQHFAIARAGQILSESIRQTDLIIRDEKNQFIVIMPDTDAMRSKVTAARIQDKFSDKFGTAMSWGAASFPDEALTFEDLLLRAQTNLFSQLGIQLPVRQSVPSQSDTHDRRL